MVKNQSAKSVMEQILAGKNVSAAISEAANRTAKKSTVGGKKVAKATRKSPKKSVKMESKRVVKKGTKRVRRLFEECEAVNSIICPVCGAESVQTRYNAETDESCFTCDACGNGFVLADATAFDLQAPITAENTDSIATVNDEGEVEVKVSEETTDAGYEEIDAPVEEIEPVVDEEGEFIEDEAVEDEAVEDEDAEIIEDEAVEDEDAEIIEDEEGEFIEDEAVEDEDAEIIEDEAAEVNPDNWDEEGNYIGPVEEYDGEVVDYPYPTPIVPEDAEMDDEDYSDEDEEDDESEDASAAIITEQRRLQAMRAANRKAKARR